jgi:hypothetical protein
MYHEVVMKYMLAFVTGHCCSLQSSPVQSYGMGPGFLPLLEAPLQT